MKVSIDVHRAPRLARDDGGLLFDGRVRDFVGTGEGSAALEALASGSRRSGPSP